MSVLLKPNLGGAMLLLVALVTVPGLLHQRLRTQQEIILARSRSMAQQASGSAFLPRKQVGQPAEGLLALLAHGLQLLPEGGVVHAAGGGHLLGRRHVLVLLMVEVILLLLQGGQKLPVAAQLGHKLLVLQHDGKLFVLQHLAGRLVGVLGDGEVAQPALVLRHPLPEHLVAELLLPELC